MADAKEAAKVKFCAKEYDLDTGEVTFTFGNGTVLNVNVTDLPAGTQDQLKMHGAVQKVGDSYAGAKGDYAAAIASATAVIDSLRSGSWTTSSGEGDAKPRLGELAAAIARIKGVEVEKALAAVEKATDEQRKAWRANVKVKAVIAQLRSEAASKALEAAGESELNVEV